MNDLWLSRGRGRVAQIRQLAVFRIKVDFSGRKLLNVSLCVNFQRQSCKVFTDLSLTRLYRVAGR